MTCSVPSLSTRLTFRMLSLITGSAEICTENGLTFASTPSEEVKVFEATRLLGLNRQVCAVHCSALSPSPSCQLSTQVSPFSRSASPPNPAKYIVPWISVLVEDSFSIISRVSANDQAASSSPSPKRRAMRSRVCSPSAPESTSSPTSAAGSKSATPFGFESVKVTDPQPFSSTAISPSSSV